MCAEINGSKRVELMYVDHIVTARNLLKFTTEKEIISTVLGPLGVSYESAKMITVHARRLVGRDELVDFMEVIKFAQLPCFSCAANARFLLGECSSSFPSGTLSQRFQISKERRF